MLKTKKQIIEDIKLIDIVIEILDARIPVSSKNPDMQKIIQNKKRIVISNKSDLAEEKETSRWVEYYNRNGIKAIVADANLGKGIKETLKQIEKIMEEDMQKAASKGRIKKNIRIMIIIQNILTKEYPLFNKSAEDYLLFGILPFIKRTSKNKYYLFNVIPLIRKKIF